MRVNCINRLVGSKISTSLHTWVTFGTRKGANASMVTTHGDMVVPKFLARNGPSGTYSHFCERKRMREK